MGEHTVRRRSKHTQPSRNVPLLRWGRPSFASEAIAARRASVTPLPPIVVAATAGGARSPPARHRPRRRALASSVAFRSSCSTGELVRVYGRFELRLNVARWPLRLPLLADPWHVDPSGPRLPTRRELSMTLSAPSEQTLREPLDRPVDAPWRKIAQIAGIFMVITFISIPALPLYDQVLNHTGFIVGSGGDSRVYLGALFEILTFIGGIGMAVTLFPVLRRQSEGLALGIYLIAKGFQPSPILYDDGPRAGVDGPLMPVLAASDVAIPLVAAP